jgi:hypothetical protein
MQKHLLKLTAVILLSSGFSLNAQEWQWLKPSVAADSRMLGADMDNLGNTYTFGSFKTSIQYDTATLSCGNACGYFAKHNSKGEIQFLQPIHNMFNVLKTDGFGNVYMASDLGGNVTKPFIGKDTLGDSVTPTNYLLLAKVNGSGKVQWTIHYKPFSNVNIPITNLFTDASGNAYLMFQYNWDIILADSTYVLSGSPGLMKVSPAGKVLMVKKLPVNFYNYRGAVDANGNIIITGVVSGYSKTITIDAITATNTNTAFNSSAYDVLVAKLNPSGVAQWVKLTNNALISSSYGPYGVSLDSKSNIYVYGGYNSKIIFGTDTLKGLITDQYTTNPFIVKYNTLGVQKWTYTTTKTTKGGMQFLKVKVSKDDKLYFYCTRPGNGSTAYVNTFHFPKTNSGGSDDRWIACFDTTMTNKWYRFLQNGETNNQRATIAISDIGDVYLASGASTNGALKLGRLDTTIVAGIGTFVQYKNFTATGNPGNDFAYIAKFAADTMATGIKQYNTSTGLRIYPNPANDVISVEAKDVKNAVLEIYSIDGRLAKQISIQSEMTKIGITDLAKGLYFIVVQTNDARMTQKLIVE